MNTEKTAINFIKEYGLLTVASVLIIISTWLFKYPNNFAFGGVNGLSIVLSKIISIPASTLNLGIKVILLVIGFVVLG